MMDNVIAFYPGKFKPFTGGHYSLVKKYLDSNIFSKLIIVISRKDKEGFKAEDSKDFIEKLFADYISEGTLEVVIADTPSPIGWCYDYLSDIAENHQDDLYKVCLVSSDKGDDISRVSYFEKSFMPGGKYESPNIILIDPKINVDPLNYTDRADNSNSGFSIGDPVSGTAARADIIAKDLNDFISNYPQPEFSKEPYKSFVVDYFDTLTSKVGSAINEGGAAGHMAHIVDINEFSFNDYEAIIRGLFENKFSISEKVDGLNCFISYRSSDNKFIVARNKTHLRGKPLMLEDLPDAFSTPTIGEIYYVACSELSRFLKTFGKEKLNQIFNGGTTWLNFEIIDSNFANIISYRKSMIIIHNFQNYESDNQSMSDTSDADIKFFNKQLSTYSTGKSHFKISGPAILTLNTDKDRSLKDKVSQYENRAIENLNKIRQSNGLTKESTMADYMEVKIRSYLDTNNLDLPSDVVNQLLNRWINADKSVRITTILKGVEEKNQANLVSKIDKGFNKIEQELKRPLHNIFVSLGDFMLSIISNLVNSDADDAANSINRVRGRLSDVKSKLSNEELQNYLSVFQNINFVNPSEGLVFKYKDYVLKLTGSFYYVNKVFHLGQEGAFASK